MTEEQILAAIALVRTKIESIISAVNRRFYLNDGSVFPDEGLPETAGVAWTSEAEVLSVIPVASRTEFLTVNILGVEYWFRDGVLVLKNQNMGIPDGSISLAKLFNMPSGTLIYRKSAGVGSPEIQTLATLLADLNLTSDDTKVDKIAGSSLILDSLKALIHAPHSDDQDLTEIFTSLNELTALINSMSPPAKIILPSADTVAGRLVGLTAGVNYPTGWVLSADDKDLIVTHGLDKEIKEVVVWSKNLLEGIKRKELGNAAYSGIYQPIGTAYNSFVIESLATINAEITIHITF